MRRRHRRTATALAFGVTAPVVGLVAAAWACVPMANLSVTPTQAQAGQEVMVSGIRFVGFGPVTIRLHTTDGPVLATAPMGPASNTIFRTSVTIPPGTPPGQVVVVAMQEPEPGGLVPWGVPARALLTVTGADGNAPPAPPAEVIDREPDLSRDSVSATAFVLAGLGVAAGALLVAGALALAAGRRGSAMAERVPGEAR